MHLEQLSEKSGRVKQAVRYSAQAKVRRKEGVIILDGIHVVREAIMRLGAQSVMSFFVTDEALVQHEVMEITEMIDARLGGVVMPSVMARLAATTSPQGIVAICKRPEKMTIDREKFILMLENVQDPTNVGAMIRTGASLGVEAVVLSVECADAWGPRALRASQGAHFYTKIVDYADTEAIADGFDGHIVGTTLGDDTISLYDADLFGATMIIMGNEGIGMTHELQQYCTEKIRIPMAGNFESLNVASACAIICAEHARQKAL